MTFFRDYFEPGLLASAQQNRAGPQGRPGQQVQNSLFDKWASGGELSPTDYYFRGTQDNRETNVRPNIAPREGYEWASKAFSPTSGEGPEMYGWYQRRPEVPQEQQYGTDIYNLYLQGLMGQGQMDDLTSRGQQGLMSGIENRPDIQQFANPMSPYAYMPIMQEPGYFNPTPLPEPPQNLYTQGAFSAPQERVDPYAGILDERKTNSNNSIYGNLTNLRGYNG